MARAAAAKKRPRPVAPLSSVAAAADAAAAALAKRDRGAQLSRAEINAVKRREEVLTAAAAAVAYTRCTGVDLLKIFATSRKQLTRYVTYGLPRNEDGTYNLELAVPWIVDHEVKRVEKKGEQAADAAEEVRELRATILRHDLAERHKELGPLDHFHQCIRDLFGGFSRGLEAFPRRVAHTLAGLDARAHEARHLVEIRKFLTRCQAGVQQLAPAGRPEAGGAKRKAKKKAKPVASRGRKGKAKKKKRTKRAKR